MKSISIVSWLSWIQIRSLEGRVCSVRCSIFGEILKLIQFQVELWVCNVNSYVPLIKWSTHREEESFIQVNFHCWTTQSVAAECLDYDSSRNGSFEVIYNSTWWHDCILWITIFCVLDIILQLSHVFSLKSIHYLIKTEFHLINESNSPCLRLPLRAVFCFIDEAVSLKNYYLDRADRQQ